MQNARKNIRKSSLYVRNWLEQQLSVKEESLTDWLLFDISKKIKSVRYTSFSRHEEARKTGADWEWWLAFNNFSLCLRIQAKKIKLKADNYPAIAYANQHGLQIKKLLQDSLKENFIPLYAFYTPDVPTTMCGANISDEGVYLAGGKTIYNSFISSGKKFVSGDDILRISNPLSCLLGCHMSLMNGGRLTNYFKRFYPEDIKNNQQSEMLGFHKELPNYVSSFIEHSKDGLPDWWESEFRPHLESVNALMVYDARNTE